MRRTPHLPCAVKAACWLKDLLAVEWEEAGGCLLLRPLSWKEDKPLSLTAGKVMTAPGVGIVVCARCGCVRAARVCGRVSVEWEMVCQYHAPIH